MQRAPGKQTISADPANNGGARNTIAIDAPARAVVLPLYSPEGGNAGVSPLPRRIMVLPWGEVPNSNGDRLVVGKRLLEEMAKETYAYGTVALDFEHNTCPGADEYERTEEPRPVAGFGRVVAEEGKGVFLEMERWTPEGLAMAHNYQDVSAVPVTEDGSPEVVAVISVALCRNGAVPGAEFRESTLSTHQPTPTPKENAMDYKAILLKLLGLPEDASDEAVAALFLWAASAGAVAPEEGEGEPEEAPEEGAAAAAGAQGRPGAPRAPTPPSPPGRPSRGTSRRAAPPRPPPRAPGATGTAPPPRRPPPCPPETRRPPSRPGRSRGAPPGGPAA